MYFIRVTFKTDIVCVAESKMPFKIKWFTFQYNKCRLVYEFKINT